MSGKQIIQVWLSFLALFEIVAVSRIYLGEHLHIVFPFIARGVASSELTSYLLSIIISFLALLRINGVIDPLNVSLWRVIALVHVMEVFVFGYLGFSNMGSLNAIITKGIILPDMYPALFLLTAIIFNALLFSAWYILKRREMLLISAAVRNRKSV